MIYFDNSATTRPCPQAVDAMMGALTEHWSNPSALYDFSECMVIFFFCFLRFLSFFFLIQVFVPQASVPSSCLSALFSFFFLFVFLLFY